MDKINEIQKEAKATYELLGAIPVSGDLVEVMAAAREHLRRVYKLAEPMPDSGETNG